VGLPLHYTQVLTEQYAGGCSTASMSHCSATPRCQESSTVGQGSGVGVAWAVAWVSCSTTVKVQSTPWGCTVVALQHYIQGLRQQYPGWGQSVGVLLHFTQVLTEQRHSAEAPVWCPTTWAGSDGVHGRRCRPTSSPPPAPTAPEQLPLLQGPDQDLRLQVGCTPRLLEPVTLASHPNRRNTATAPRQHHSHVLLYPGPMPHSGCIAQGSAARVVEGVHDRDGQPAVAHLLWSLACIMPEEFTRAPPFADQHIRLCSSTWRLQGNSTPPAGGDSLTQMPYAQSSGWCWYSRQVPAVQQSLHARRVACEWIHPCAEGVLVPQVILRHQLVTMTVAAAVGWQQQSNSSPQ
jgi:hypothetical protein